MSNFRKCLRNVKILLYSIHSPVKIVSPCYRMRVLCILYCIVQYFIYIFENPKITENRVLFPKIIFLCKCCPRKLIHTKLKIINVKHEHSLLNLLINDNDCRLFSSVEIFFFNSSWSRKSFFTFLRALNGRYANKLRVNAAG